MTIKCLVILYFLTCSYIYGTSVDQERMSSCYSYGKCYNHVWCDNVLSSRNCSEKHLVRKLECLSALFADWSNESQWSDTINSLKDNVTMTMKQVHDFKEEIVDIKSDCSKTTTELNARRQQNEKNTEEIKKLDLSCTNIRNNLNNINHSMLQLREQGDKTGKTIETISTELSTLTKQFELFKSDTLTNHSKSDELMSNRAREVKGEISNTEAKFKDLLAKDIEKADKKMNTLGQKIFANQEKLNVSLNSLNDTVSYHEGKFNETLHELSKEMHDKFDNIETKRKQLEADVKDVEAVTKKEIQEKTETVKQQMTVNIGKNSEEFAGKINNVSTSINSKIENTNADITTLSTRLGEFKNSFENKLKTESEKLQGNIDDNTKKVNTKLEKLETSTKSDISKINTDISEVRERVEKVKSESEQNIQGVSKSLTGQLNEKILEVKSLQDKSLQEAKNNIEGLRTEIKTLIKAEIETLLNKTLEVNQTVSQQQKLVEVIYPNTFNKEMFIIAFLVLVVMVAVNFGIVYILVKRSSPLLQAGVRRISKGNSQSDTHLQEQPHSPVEVLNRLTFPKSLPAELSDPLSDSVAVISFYEDAQKQHRRLMAKVEELLTEDVKVEYHVIRRHEHIPEIPRAKLCIMFVEFSERHVIIEEPGLGLGDLKRKTASFINAMGACLTIVYVKDPGSRHLKSSDLYNSNIYCVRSQPELTVLSKNDRFLSVYDTFNESQTQRLADVIKANIGQGRTLNPGTTTKHIRKASGGRLNLNLRN